MAKKSAAARQTKAAQRPASAAKPATVRLVRPEGTPPATTQQSNNSSARLIRQSAATATVERETAAKPTAKPTLTSTSTTTAPRSAALQNAIAASRTAPVAPKAPAQPAPRPATPAAKPVTPAGGAKVSEARIQRAAATKARRAESIVTPEHYAYVLKDLRLTFGLALFMFAVIIILHFVLPS